MSVGFKGRFKSKSLAYSIMPGNIISNPIGLYCSLSVTEAEFNSINRRPATRERILIHLVA